MRPFSVTIKRVKCFSTTDISGSDDLFGVMGPVKFRIGSFAAGDDHSLNITETVPAGEFFLRIIEEDPIRDDDVGVIDLAEVMDFDFTRNVQGSGGNYDITVFVESVAD